MTVEAAQWELGRYGSAVRLNAPAAQAFVIVADLFYTSSWHIRTDLQPSDFLQIISTIIIIITVNTVNTKGWASLPT